MVLTSIKSCGRANFNDVASFIETMSPDTRIYQFTHDTAPDLVNTVCVVVKGWHRGKWDAQDHFTCRLKYQGWCYKSGYYRWWAEKEYGSIHVYEDGSESMSGGRRTW